MKKFLSILLIFTSLFVLLNLTGCSKKNLLNPKKPVTLTMWHNFGGDMQKTADTLIDEFNSTVGKKQGIIINVTAISASMELQEKLNMIVNGDPGAPEMPDIFTAYPKTAVLFKNKDKIVNLDGYFSQNELAQYVNNFIEEGRFGDGGLYVFPFAKSTEIMYLNQTLFDRFSAQTGVKIDALATLDGIADTAIRYYQWTDEKTPDIKNDGKMFFSADSWLNIAQTAMQQQESNLFENEKLSLNNEKYKKVWEIIYSGAVKGGIATYDGYSSDLSKTGDIICSTGSSAGILFYGDTITYKDNTVEKVEYNILPYPVIKDGKKIAIQRGNGLCVAKSTESKEYAASVFIKWFTKAEQNMRFVSQTGYLPVTNDAFENKMQAEIDGITDEKIKKMLIAATKMYNEYSFYTTPTFEAVDSISKKYEKNFKSILSKDRETYITTENVDFNLMMKNAMDEIIAK